jgi:hypothetical protein
VCARVSASLERVVHFCSWSSSTTFAAAFTGSFSEAIGARPPAAQACSCPLGRAGCLNHDRAPRQPWPVQRHGRRRCSLPGTISGCSFPDAARARIDHSLGAAAAGVDCREPLSGRSAHPRFRSVSPRAGQAEGGGRPLPSAWPSTWSPRTHRLGPSSDGGARAPSRLRYPWAATGVSWSESNKRSDT